MAMSTPKRGKERALAHAASDHARALREQPGCLAAYVMHERGSNRQIALSVFDSQAAFHRAMEATAPVIAGHHLEQLRHGASEFRVFDVS